MSNEITEDVTSVRLERETKVELERFIRSRISYNDVVVAILRNLTPEATDKIIAKLEKLSRERASKRGGELNG